MNKRELFVSCDCGCSTIVVSKLDDNIDDSINVGVLTYAGQSFKLTLREAIIVACRALFHRRVNEDFTMLSKENAKKLGKWLIENTKTQRK